jgi:hypothetical protein
MGAIARIKDELSSQTPAINCLRDVHGSGLAEFNDATGTKHSDVLALFDRAIAKLEKEAK